MTTLPRPGSPETRRPIHLLTGFLGSGKTTLLRTLLADPAFADTAVIVNEFGEVGLDHLLVKEVTDDVVLLGSGCLCCVMRDDLVSILADLPGLMGQTGEAGAPRPFRRVVIETTGLADPRPILQAVMVKPELTRQYRVGSVVTAVDAINGQRTLTDFVEAQAQVATADRLIITKADLVGEDVFQALEARLVHLNAAATVIASRQGAMDAALFDDHERSLDAIAEAVASLPEPDPAHDHDHDHDHGHSHHIEDERISSFVVEIDHPVVWADFVEWLELLLANRGHQILRAKGLLAVEGKDVPVVVQGVQHVFYPPELLPAWPDGEARTRLVFITRDLTQTAIERSIGSFFGA